MTSLIHDLEHVSMRAWPALETEEYDGWILRFADGYTRRANSVYPLGASGLPLDLKIEHCEAVYAERGQPTHFKMTDASLPPDLDMELERAGYAKAAPTSVQTLNLEKATLDDPVSIEALSTEAWAAHFVDLNDMASRYLETMRQMLSAIAVPTCFAALQREGQVVAVGLAVADEGWLGLFDVLVHPMQRGMGLGTALVTSLLHWGREAGAQQAYLQVMHSNGPALRLYQKVGFRHRYTYWYRSRSNQR